MNTGEVAFIAVETRKSREVVFWARRPKIMVIGDRLKMLRETKNLSQGDIKTNWLAPLLPSLLFPSVNPTA